MPAVTAYESCCYPAARAQRGREGAVVNVMDAAGGTALFENDEFRPNEFGIDVTPALKEGANQITIRVLSNFDVFGVSGLYERMFLYNRIGEKQE